jgi:hypothetical protein
MSKSDTMRRSPQEATATREKKARLYHLHSPKPCSTFPRRRAMISPEGAREEAAQSDKERLGRKRRPGHAGYKELICSTMAELMLGVVASPRVPMQTCNRKYVAISAGRDASSAAIEAAKRSTGMPAVCFGLACPLLDGGVILGSNYVITSTSWRERLRKRNTFCWSADDGSAMFASHVVIVSLSRL